MARTAPHIKSKPPVSRWLMLLLPLVSLVFAFAIAQTEGTAGYMIIFGIIGLGVTILSFAYPVFGFYFTIVVSYFFADLKRLLHLDLPIGVYIDLLCMLTFIGVIVQKTIRKQPTWAYCDHPIVFAFLAIIVYSLIQIFNPNGGPISASIVLLRRFIALQLMFYCAVQLLGTPREMFNFLKFWFAMALITGLYGVYQEWFGYPAYELNHILSNPLIEALLSLDNGNYRKFSFLPDPTSFGIMMSASALICICFLLWWKGKGWRKYLIAFTAVILLLAMSYSGTRTATFSFLTGISLLILMTLSNRKTLVFATVCFVGFLALLFAPIYNNATLNRLRSTFEFSNDASMNVRDVNRHSIQPYMHSHPIGGGLGTTGGDFADLELGSSFAHPLKGFKTDSGFLRVALEYGWIGLIMQCLAFFIVLQQGVKVYYRSTDPRNRLLLLVAVICIFSYVVAHYAQGAIGTLPGAFLFYSLVAMIIRLRPDNILKTKSLNR
ncbi:MAG: O-antigen ligase domain-containing protein [Chitinophagaceae bacterium]|nr:MAG: O-antigen ligase domain-containing protein [Chitinophagaceae bacterium]